jgi:hypothetical protein
MSAKFKPGDLVEVIKNSNLSDSAKLVGKIGKIISYVGDIRNAFLLEKAWKVSFSDTHTSHELHHYVTEPWLRLVPGIDEYKEIGSWDFCPWTPYKEKEKKSEYPTFDYDFI